MTMVAPKTINPTPSSRRRRSGGLLTSEEERSATDCRQSTCQGRQGKLQREAAGARRNGTGGGRRRGARQRTGHRRQETKWRGRWQSLADDLGHGVGLRAG